MLASTYRCSGGQAEVPGEGALVVKLAMTRLFLDTNDPRDTSEEMVRWCAARGFCRHR